MKTETICLGTNEQVTLTTYLLDSSDEMPNARIRPAIVVFPGGGYRMCSDREAEPIALAFVAQGYHAFVLRYSLNEDAAFPKPLQDAEAALEFIRSKAAAWGVNPDKIAVCGFSAGGHLAAAVGTMGRIRPHALILGYPCILDSIANRILPAPVPSLEKLVDAHTPPTFIFSTANDALVPVNNSIQFAAALDQARVPFELHIFTDGTHGLSLAAPHTSQGLKNLVNPAVARWFALCVTWLDHLFGSFAANIELPEISTDEATEYNVDQPLQICWANPECQKLILDYLPDLAETPNLRAALSVSLRAINAYSQILSEEMLDELNQKLASIPFSVET